MLVGNGRRRTSRAVARWEREYTLASERLVIRPARVEDREEVLTAIDDEVRHWQGFDDAAVERWAQNMAPEDPRTVLKGPASSFVVCETHGPVIGAYRFGSPRSPGPHATLGWWLGPSGRGRGLGTESLAMMLAYADRVGLPGIDMGTALDNVRARRQVESTGAEVIEHDVPHTLPDGRVDRAVWYRHTAARVDRPG